MDEKFPTIEDFGTVMRSLAGAFHKWTVSQMGAVDWSHAVMEVRYSKDGSYWHDKMRAGCPGQPQTSLDSTHEVRALLPQLNRLRRVFPKEWFSFKLTITKAGNVHVDWGYDPNTAEDPSFFDD
jgi:hypothetical protein